MEKTVRHPDFTAGASALLVSLTLTACTLSPNGSVDEIVKTRPPTFSGQSNIIFRTPTTTYEVKGECDPISYALEWSYDQKTWTTIEGGCPNGTFAITVTLKFERFVYVREKTKLSYTSLATADVRLTLAPTSPTLTFVSAGNADNEQPSATQFGMEGITKATMSQGNLTIKSSLVDTIYDR